MCLSFLVTRREVSNDRSHRELCGSQSQHRDCANAFWKFKIKARHLVFSLIELIWFLSNAD